MSGPKMWMGVTVVVWLTVSVLLVNSVLVARDHQATPVPTPSPMRVTADSLPGSPYMTTPRLYCVPSQDTRILLECDTDPATLGVTGPPVPVTTPVVQPYGE